MGKNQSKVLQESIINSVTNNIVDTIQSVSNTTSSNQSLNIDCTQLYANQSNSYNACLDRNFTRSADDALKLCEPILNIADCSVNGLVISNAILVTNSGDQISQAKQRLDENFTAKVESDIKQKAGLFSSFSNKDNQTLRSIIDDTVNTIDANRNSIFDDVNNQQQINIGSGDVKYITMSSVTKKISDYVQNSQSIQESAKSLTNSLLAKTDQGGSSGLLDWIFKIIMIVIVVLILIGVILWVLKKMRKENKKEKK